MKFLALLFVLHGFVLFHPLSACENSESTDVRYLPPENELDCQIDALLNISEECLFTNNFSIALTHIEKAEDLLQLTKRANEHRRLRFLFDKALIVACIGEDEDGSREQFDKFETLLATKKCANKSDSSQPNLFDRNGHWPVLGEDKISIEECLERVERVERTLEIACAGLNVSPCSRVLIEAAIFAIADRAKLCCTTRGFWKTCIQPVVDSWKRTELFGIPPDPYWD